MLPRACIYTIPLVVVGVMCAVVMCRWVYNYFYACGMYLWYVPVTTGFICCYMTCMLVNTVTEVIQVNGTKSCVCALATVQTFDSWSWRNLCDHVNITMLMNFLRL